MVDGLKNKYIMASLVTRSILSLTLNIIYYKARSFLTTCSHHYPRHINMQMLTQSTFLTIAATPLLLASATLINLSDGIKLNITTNPLPTGISPSVVTKCANLVASQFINDTSVIWEDCPTVVIRYNEYEAEFDMIQKRGIICKKRNGYQLPCYMSNSRSISLKGSGT